MRVFLRLRRSVVLPTKPPCYAGYSDGGSVLCCPLSLEVSIIHTLNSFNSSNKLRFNDKNRPDSYKNKFVGIAPQVSQVYFLFFSHSVFLFFRFCLVMGNPWRVNNRKINTQVETFQDQTWKAAVIARQRDGNREALGTRFR